MHWQAGFGGEHQVPLVRPVLGGELFLVLLGAVGTQRGDQVVVERQVALALLGLEVLQRVLAVESDQLDADVNDSFVEVDVGPTQAERFALP